MFCSIILKRSSFFHRNALVSTKDTRYFWSQSKAKKPAAFSGGSNRPQLSPLNACLLVIPVTSFCLGVWQIRRLKWKLALIEDLERRRSVPLEKLPADLAELRDLEFMPVKVRGRFDHSREVVASPRSRVINGEQVPNQVGGNVVTPFILADRDLTILVNRGWVPRDRFNPGTRVRGQVAKELELTGLIRFSDARGHMVDNDPKGGRWLFRDVEGMANHLGTAPVWIDANAESTVPDGPLGGQTHVKLRNEHFNYALTWFGLSFVTSYMWYARYLMK